MQWEYTLGGPGDDLPNSVELTADGGYLVGATTDSFGAGGKDYWVFELDDFGRLVWESTYGGAGDDFCQRLVKTSDGDYLLAGYSDSFATPYGDPIEYNGWILKVDSQGSVAWEKIYNKPFEDNGVAVDAPDRSYNIVETSEGLYAVSGDTDSWDNERSWDSWIFVVDPDGNLGCGIETETDALRLSRNDVTVIEGNLFFSLLFPFQSSSTSAAPYPPESETFVHCPPNSAPPQGDAM